MSEQVFALGSDTLQLLTAAVNMTNRADNAQRDLEAVEQQARKLCEQVEQQARKLCEQAAAAVFEKLRELPAEFNVKLMNLLNLHYQQVDC